MIYQLFANPKVMYANSGFNADTPQLYLDINRTKAESLGVPIANIYQTLQSKLASVYINDFNLIGYAFDVLGVNRVEAHYMVGNERSRRVMEKCGMSFEGILRQYMLVKGSYRDIGVCAVTRDGFQEQDCYRKVPMHWIDRLF